VRTLLARRMALAGLGNGASGSWVPDAPSPGLLQTAYGYLFNAATGNVSQDQFQQLVNQEAQSLVQAGMDPVSAQAQANQDVTATLNSATLPGGFGVTWTGAAPTSETFTSAAESAAAGAVTGSSIWDWLATNWPYLAAGLVGIWFLSREL
jgi:hypothetical protein